MEEFQRLRAGPERHFRKVPPGVHFKFSRRYSSLWRRRLVKTRAGSRAGAQLLSPRILTDLKYSNLSLFDTATRIFIYRGFFQNFDENEI